MFLYLSCICIKHIYLFAHSRLLYQHFCTHQSWPLNHKNIVSEVIAFCYLPRFRPAKINDLKRKTCRIMRLKANSGVRKSDGREAYYAQTGIYVWCKSNSEINASKSFKLNWNFDYAKWVFFLKPNMQIIQIHLLQQLSLPKLSFFPFVLVQFSINHSDLRLLKVWTRDFDVQINSSWICRESVTS